MVGFKTTDSPKDESVVENSDNGLSKNYLI
jgi:hypothetical protein